MSFARTHAAITAMLPEVALATPMARAIVRKAGLRASQPGLERPKTVIEGVLDPLEEQGGRMWLVDLSGMERIRFSAESSVAVHLLRQSTALDSAIDITTARMTGLTELGASVFLSSSRADSASGDVEWYTVPDALRTTQKLAISTQTDALALNASLLDGPFSFSVQLERPSLEE